MGDDRNDNYDFETLHKDNLETLLRKLYNAGVTGQNKYREPIMYILRTRFTEKLISSLDKASDSSKKLSQAGIALTVIIAIMTLVLVYLTIILVNQDFIQSSP